MSNTHIFKEYDKIDAISNTRLGWIANGPQYYLEQLNKGYEKYKPYFDFGTALDVLALQGRDAFDAEIACIAFDIPEGKTGDFIRRVIFNQKELNLDFKQSCEAAYAESGFKLSMEAVMKKFAEHNAYYEKAMLHYGKVIMSPEQKDQLQKCLVALYSHPTVNKILNHIGLVQHSIITKLFANDDVFCKGILDKYFDYNTDFELGRCIIDLKTTAYSAESFVKTLVAKNYDRQMGWYAAIANCPRVYMVVVESFGNNPNVKVFKINEDILNIGFDKAMKLYKKLKWHIENNNWNNRECVEGDGIVPLTIEDIKSDYESYYNESTT